MQISEFFTASISYAIHMKTELGDLSKQKHDKSQQNFIGIVENENLECVTVK